MGVKFMGNQRLEKLTTRLEMQILITVDGGYSNDVNSDFNCIKECGSWCVLW